MSVRQIQGETQFSPLLINVQFFLVKIPLIYEHLFCKYFVGQLQMAEM